MNRIYKIILNGFLSHWSLVSGMTKGARKTSQKKFFIYTLIIGIALFSPSFDICAANSGQRIEGANGALVIEGGIKETTETQTDATGHLGPYQQQWDGAAISGLAVGSRAKAYFGSVAIGDNPSVNSRYGIGIGSDAFIDRRSDTDLDSDIGKTFGNRQQAGASVRSIAIGTSSLVKGSFAGLSLGNETKVNKADRGVAIGDNAAVDNALRGIAIGHGSKVNESPLGVSIGSTARAENARASIAMGSSSSTKNSV